jgi:hypothetical protein
MKTQFLKLVFCGGALLSMANISAAADFHVTSAEIKAGAVGGANLPKGAAHVRIDYGVAWGRHLPTSG